MGEAEMKYGFWKLSVLLSVALVGGCNPPTESASDDAGSAEVSTIGDANHAHSHHGGDELVWQRADLEHEGYVISLGHHGKQLYAGHSAEPAVMVTRNGEPVADAKVFVTLLDSTGKEVIVSEQATIYEPTTAEEPAHYAQASIKLPADAREVTVQYRLELPAASEFSDAVVIQAVAH
jgi:hypothetical protein